MKYTTFSEWLARRDERFYCPTGRRSCGCPTTKRAKEIVQLFLAHGADPTIRNKDGLTAADLASKRGLDEAAELLRSGRKPPTNGKDHA